MTTSRRFQLFRKVDHTGVSGTGTVADGVVWPDGTVAIRWRGPYTSTVIRPSLDDTKKVHGHGGDTDIQWIDPEPESASAQIHITSSGSPDARSVVDRAVQIGGEAL